MSAEVKPGYKQTEVGVIPEDWEITPLGRQCELITKGTTPTSLGKSFTTSGINFIKAETVSESGRVVPNKLAFIDSLTHNLLKRSQLLSGDLLISIAGVLGRVGVVDDRNLPANTNQALAIVRLSKTSEIHRGYLTYQLRSPTISKQISDINVQAAQANISLQNVNDFQIPLPPTKLEQQRIAEALSDADALIEGLVQLISKKRQLKQGAMQKLLCPRSGWTEAKLGEICDVEIGRTPSRRNSAFWGKGYTWLSIADLKTKYISSSKEEITELAASDMKIIKKGTLLMSFKLSIGRLCFAGRDLFTNEAICSFSNPKADANFLYYMLGRTDFSLYGKQAVKGYTLNKESLNAVVVFLPSKPEQTATATILSDIDAEIAGLEVKLAKARRIKEGMMQDLLTGKVRLV